MAIKNYVVIHGVLRLATDVVNPGESVAMDEMQAAASLRKEDGDGGVLVSESEFKSLVSQIKDAEKTKTPLSATLRKLKQGMSAASIIESSKVVVFQEPRKLKGDDKKDTDVDNKKVDDKK